MDYDVIIRGALGVPVRPRAAIPAPSAADAGKYAHRCHRRFASTAPLQTNISRLDVPVQWLPRPPHKLKVGG